MRVLVLGGTRFIGRAIVEHLAQRGDEVTVVHRGQWEPPDLPDVRHLHIARADWPAHAAELQATQPDAVIDCMALFRADVQAALAALPDTHLVVISSQDVYRAFASLEHGGATDAVPITEAAPVREDRYPYRGVMKGFDDYSKLDVEEDYLARRACVLRLPAVYGEHDGQRREDFILRRLQAGRSRIPVGQGGLLWTRAYVRDIARGTVQAAADPSTAGEIFNLGEESSWTVRQWAAKIIEAADSSAELVAVPDSSLPPDMQLTGGEIAQHVLVSSAKARTWFGYTDTDPMVALRASVAWHMKNPPENPDADFSADDAALAVVARPELGADLRTATEAAEGTTA